MEFRNVEHEVWQSVRNMIRFLTSPILPEGKSSEFGSTGIRNRQQPRISVNTNYFVNFEIAKSQALFYNRRTIIA